MKKTIAAKYIDYIRIRRLWKINPAMRVKESKKVYFRKSLKQQDLREGEEN